MILFGRAEFTYTLNEPIEDFCPKCSKDQPFKLTLNYVYGHFYHLFGWVQERKYRLTCPECGGGWLLNRKPAEELIGGDPVPAFQKFSWLLGVALVVFLVIAVPLYRSAA